MLESKMMWFANFQNPFIVLIALSLLIISLDHNFYNKTINLISGLSLFIYIIHENIIFSNYTRLSIGTYLFNRYGQNNTILISVLFAAVVFIFAAILSYLYRISIQRITRKVSLAISNKYDTLVCKLSRFL